MKRKWIFSVVAAGFAGAALAGAGSGNMQQQSADQMYNQLDANGDGYISPDEAAANPQLAEKFKSLDANEDNRLDQGEFAQFEAEHGQQKDSEDMK